MNRSEDEPLYFFPERHVTEGQLRRLLAQGTSEQRAWAISHLLRFAQWDDIWRHVSREQVREIFPELELGKLRDAWARMLKVDLKVDEAPVGSSR